MSSGPQLETIRIFGVLQRFGITYFVVALLYFIFMSRKSSKIQVSVYISMDERFLYVSSQKDRLKKIFHFYSQSPMLREVQDFLLLLPQWCVMLVIVAVHCVITFCLHVPGCPTYVGTI